ncbi:MAG: transporter [Paludibacteraceae bacterium]|nr:transporter [Paludibacteraceae bacterium]
MGKSIVNRKSSIRQLFDANALWLSMVIGALGYKLFLPLAPILPWLIFGMLFFTFCKIDPLDLRLHKWHWVVLTAQIVLSLATYAGVYWLTGNRFLAQGLLMCFIMPTATAAPIIAGKMGGSIQNLTSFTLLSNFATSLIVPALFPLINPAAEKAFIPAFLLILSRVAPLLLGPFFSAWLLRIGYQWRTKKEFVLSKQAAQIPFYLWVTSITVLFATVTNTVLSTFNIQHSTILWLLIGAFFACLLQFGLGKLIGYYLPAPSKGRDYQDVLINPAAAPKNMNEVSSITAGQAFGQKNTSLGVWMAHTYLNPMAALGAAAYIIWQNLFNSLQLTIAAHKK